MGHKYIPDEYCDLPFTADTWGPSGIYFMPRRANNQLVFGSVDHRFESEIVDPDNYNDTLDPDFKQECALAEPCLPGRLRGPSDERCLEGAEVTGQRGLSGPSMGADGVRATARTLPPPVPPLADVPLPRGSGDPRYLNALFHRLPGLDTSGEIVGFSSMYTVNQDDVHPMIGETQVPGLWACNGFSGAPVLPRPTDIKRPGLLAGHDGPGRSPDEGLGGCTL